MFGNIWVALHILLTQIQTEIRVVQVWCQNPDVSFGFPMGFYNGVFQFTSKIKPVVNIIWRYFGVFFYNVHCTHLNPKLSYRVTKKTFFFKKEHCGFKIHTHTYLTQVYKKKKNPHYRLLLYSELLIYWWLLAFPVFILIRADTSQVKSHLFI